jgi:hypothetical protein
VPLARWEFRDGLDDQLGNLHGSLKGKAELGKSGLLLDGRTAYVATAPLKKHLRAKTLEAWLSLDNLEQRGGGVIGVQTLGGDVFDAIVFGERNPAQWIAGSDNFSRTQDFSGPAETETQQLVHVAIVYSDDGSVTGYRNGQPYGKPYRTSPPVTFEAEQAQVLIGLRHGSAGETSAQGRCRRGQLYDRAASGGNRPVGRRFSEFVARPTLWRDSRWTRRPSASGWQTSCVAHRPSWPSLGNTLATLSRPASPGPCICWPAATRAILWRWFRPAEWHRWSAPAPTLNCRSKRPRPCVARRWRVGLPVPRIHFSPA